MLAPVKQQHIILAAQGVHRIEDGKGQLVTCLKGPIWITQEDDRRDIVLASGQAFRLDREGLAVVYALRGAELAISSPWQVNASASVPVRSEPLRARA